MKYLYLTFNWIFGVLFLIAGVLSFVESPVAGLCMIGAAAILLPPVRSFVHSKTNNALPVKARVVSVFALFLAFGFFIGQAQNEKAQELAAQQDREKAQKTAQLRQERIDYFNANREQIIFSIKKALSEKDYQSVSSETNKYLVSGDKELEQISVQAKKELADIQEAEKTERLLVELKEISTEDYEKNRNLYQQLLHLNPDNELYKTKVAFYAGKVESEKTNKILGELKSVPTEEYEKNKGLYQQLLNLHPDNELYKTKVAFYAGKIEEDKKKQIVAEARMKDIKSKFSAWDGSHRGLERVIKGTMNDPNSYEHVETVYWDRGDHLVVMTTFRGKNVFGGVVKNSVKAKVSLDGQVLQIID